jgi:uncharacterized cupredoxin-like copper-binding protein
MKGQMMKSTLLLTSLLILGAPLAHAHGDMHDKGAMGMGMGTKNHAMPQEAVAEQTAWGVMGQPAQVTRTIELDMNDAMRFMPASITVRQGDTVRFVVRNRGRMLHEAVIGTPDALAQHAAMMVRFPNMQHDEPYLAHVAPGQSGEIVWHFNRAGSFELACLMPGHYEAGMRSALTVTP